MLVATPTIRRMLLPVALRHGGGRTQQQQQQHFRHQMIHNNKNVSLTLLGQQKHHKRSFSVGANGGNSIVSSTETLDLLLHEPMNDKTRHLGDQLLDGNRVALSKSITLIESTRLDHLVQAQHLLDYVVEGRANRESGQEGIGGFRLGVAGPPGAGKSTFIEALGTMLVSQGKRVAVVAIDPSSSRTGGSILGDMTRMTELARSPNAFVRPSPTHGQLGGVAQHTNDVVLLCEAAAFDVVIVETVGLGQSEVLVDNTVDMLMLLVPPAGGDELQGVKKGIMEVADMVVVNKADGELKNAASHAATDYMHALQLMRRKHPKWRPRVKLASAATKYNVEKVWEICEKFRKKMNECGAIADKRTAQSKEWLWTEIGAMVMTRINADPAIQKTVKEEEAKLMLGHSSPRKSARRILDTLFTRK